MSISSFSNTTTQQVTHEIPDGTLPSPRRRRRRENRRLVLFAGPHKSASTSIQEFFTQHMANTNHHGIHPSFVNWTWPWDPMAQHPQAYNDLIVNYPGKDQSQHDFRRTELYYTISYVWNSRRPPMRLEQQQQQQQQNSSPPHEQEQEQENDQDEKPKEDDVDENSASSSSSQVGAAPFTNVIFGTEEFDRVVEQSPWSRRDGIQAMENILRLTHFPPQVDIVVNYRTPRVAHWISVWKQLTKSTSPYVNLLRNQAKAYEHLNSVANPLGLVHAIRNYNDQHQHRRRRHGHHRQSTTTAPPTTWWNVTLIDMGGVELAQRDISHVIACEVLLVPCTKTGYVQGLEHLKPRSNQRSGDPGLTQVQLEELEWLFRQRDCSYAKELLNDPGVTILYRESLWQESDCAVYNPTFQNVLRTNGTYFLQLVRSQVGLGMEDNAVLYEESDDEGKDEEEEEEETDDEAKEERQRQRQRHEDLQHTISNLMQSIRIIINPTTPQSTDPSLWWKNYSAIRQQQQEQQQQQQARRNQQQSSTLLVQTPPAVLPWSSPSSPFLAMRIDDPSMSTLTVLVLGQHFILVLLLVWTLCHLASCRRRVPCRIFCA
jgi:hypothetical protein